MVPPTGPLNLDVEAISGICGSVSIACWVVVFSPQIIENFRRGSADGLSLQFVIVWLAGDVFNILGAVLQGVLPTMIILAFYYTIADIVLLGQCFYYRGFTWHDDVAPPKAKKNKARRVAAAVAAATPTGGDDDINSVSTATERTALLAKAHTDDSAAAAAASSQHNPHERRGSNWSALSPAVPFVHDLAGSHTAHEAHHHQHAEPAPTPAAAPARPSSLLSARLQTAAFNIVAMLMVCAAGVAGWYLSSGHSRTKDGSGGDGNGDNGAGDSDSGLALNAWGQVFGYLCAALYLGSRLPQLLLNWRRQSTEGVSMLFFLFACLGNLTYVLSIFAYDGCAGDSCTEPGEARRRYGRYLLVNLSWLAGSLGTLLLDMGIFVQFFLYRVEGGDEESETEVDGDSDDYDNNSDEDEDDEDEDDPRWDQRPILQRNMSNHY